MTKSGRGWGLLVAGLAVMTAGCGNLPNQSHPTCSWTTQPPSNADTICSQTFKTLRDLADADTRGKNKVIRLLVTNRSVAARIEHFGAVERAAGLTELHVVPSLTLGILQTGSQIGVGFHLGGHTRRGSFEGSETVYMQIRGGKAYVVLDQPSQEW